MRPKVSIVTASYNALDGLKETVASVAQQTADAYEHIVIDGGSSDGSREWLDETDVRWISEPDHGIADALNKAINMAKGEWVLVLHAEDTFLHSRSLEMAMADLIPDRDIVSYDVLLVEPSASKIYKSSGFVPLINFKTTIPHQGAFCRRSLFDEIGPFDTSFQIALDYEFFLRAYRRKKEAVVKDEILARMPTTGISSRSDWHSLETRFTEERRAHAKHSSGVVMRLVYRIYWPGYLPYRRIRHAVSRQGKG